MSHGTVERFAHGATNRYVFDGDLCSVARGWAQVDTGSDASYFGTWANPSELRVLVFAEGDVTLETCLPDEFASCLREHKRWHNEQGDGFIGVDCMCNEALKARFVALGLGDLLH